MDATRFFTTMASPLGSVRLTSSGRVLTGLYLEKFGGRTIAAPEPSWKHEVEPFDEIVAQLREYFAGKRRQFAMPLAGAGTVFQQRVRDVLVDIPFGETRSYGEIARALGQPGAARAVGLASGRNRFFIIVPCHRVLGAGGALTGYGGGLERKRWLLAHEEAAAAG